MVQPEINIEVNLPTNWNGRCYMFITLAYHTPAASHPDSAVLNVLATLLGDAPSGRLYKALVENSKAVRAGNFKKAGSYSSKPLIR